MQTYDDLVEVRNEPAAGWGVQPDGAVLERPFPEAGQASAEGPQQFLWRGRLWQVREVLAHWSESGAWWIRSPEEAPGRSSLVTERWVWRVSAARGRDVATAEDPGFGIFDLTFDPSAGAWRLAGSLD